MGVAAPLGQPAPLEVVDERDHRAAMDAEGLAQCLLGLAFRSRKVAEHPEMPRVEVERRQALGEAPVLVGAELHQQKPGTPTQRPRRGRLRAGGISGHLPRVSLMQNC